MKQNQNVIKTEFAEWRCGTDREEIRRNNTDVPCSWLFLVYNDIAPSITDTAPSVGVWRGSF